jgi:hypothetical protein
MEHIKTAARTREKVFGFHGVPLDASAKNRILENAGAWNAAHKQPGQHQGPLTQATLRVLRALLFQFHNAKTGYCFPGYEAIAAAAHCSRASVARAIVALEEAGLMSWANRLVRKIVNGAKVLWRTSNAYVFRDPLPCAETRRKAKSQNDFRTESKSKSSLKIDEGLEKALDRFAHLGGFSMK